MLNIVVLCSSPPPQKEKEAFPVLAPPYVFPASATSYYYLADFTPYTFSRNLSCSYATGFPLTLCSYVLFMYMSTCIKSLAVVQNAHAWFLVILLVML